MSLTGSTPLKKSTGDNNSRAQTFWSQNVLLYNGDKFSSFNFDTPQFLTLGGTKQYYSQDPKSIFTSQNSPFFRFNFTANTHSLSGSTKIVHDIYKLNYEDYKKFNPNFNKTGSDLDVNDNVNITEEEVVENGITTVRTTTKRTTQSGSTQNFQKNDLLDFQAIQEKLQKPFITITSGVSGFTNIYDLFLGQFVKPNISASTFESNNFSSEPRKTELFEDRSQYFIDTYFSFQKEVDPSFKEAQNLFIDGRDNAEDFENLELTTDLNSFEGDVLNFDVNLGSIRKFTTKTDTHSITAGTFENTLVKGYFLTYFQVPNKPVFEQPIMSGTLETFSSPIYFSNVDDGDKYLLELTYDIDDLSFSGQTFIYDIEKDLVDGIQKIGAPFRTQSSFRYRVGNVKSIRNIFNVDQTVVTFSNSLTGITQSEPASIYVQGEIDSPYSPDLGGWITPPSIMFESADSYSLSGTISGSLVTGATVQLVDPQGVTKTQTTNMVGEYLFTGLYPAKYNLYVEYRGYKDQNHQIELVQSAIKNIDLEILWGNDYDTWGYKAGDIIN